MISLLFNSQVELKMSEEKLTTALAELKEAAKYMIKLSKRLVRETNGGVRLSNYEFVQDTFLLLEDSTYVVNVKLLDWEVLLPEDGDGDPIYPDIYEDGYEFTPVKYDELMKNMLGPN